MSESRALIWYAVTIAIFLSNSLLNKFNKISESLFQGTYKNYTEGKVLNVLLNYEHLYNLKL